MFMKSVQISYENIFTSLLIVFFSLLTIQNTFSLCYAVAS